MRVLLLGAAGQVGHELMGLVRTFALVDAPRSAELDIADTQKVVRAVARTSPSVIINAAAHTNVDDAERQPERAMAVNAKAVANLGEVATKRRALLIHFSTDYVFSGSKALAYDESDDTGPINVYGRSKLAGEQALVEMQAPAIILRTSWVYGLRSPCFVTKILAFARQGAPASPLRVVDGQQGSPTYCRDLAAAVAMILFQARSDPHGVLSPHRGIYHVAGSGQCSRVELARATLALAGLDPSRIHPSNAPGDGAKRPANSALDSGLAASTFGVKLPAWEESLARAFADHRCERLPARDPNERQS